jgi:oligosaccharyltransferase complex subunit alpha (ribophorin I)
MKTFFAFILVSTILVLSNSQTLELFRDITIQKVERRVDCQTQLCKIDTRLDIKNERDSQLKEFYFAIPSESTETLRLFTVRDNYENSPSYTYKILDNLKIKNDYNATLYRIEFDSPLKPGQTKTLKTNEIHWGMMQPYPKQITSLEDQRVLLEDSVYYFTAYTVISQNTDYVLSAAPISFSDSEGRLRGPVLQYSISSTVGGFQRRPNKIHFENNTPFVVFKEVTKVIEVSHWGNINIQEFYKLANEGAAFKGEYSKVDFSIHNRNSGKNALRALPAKYPVHAWGMHYRDEVGNISTSRAWRDSSNVNLQIQPRFAIFGGWSHNWEISYNLPTNYYLFAKNDDPTSFVCKQDFGFPFENLLAEKYTIKIILPEGSTNATTELPFAVDNQYETKTFSYLDYQGRPTLVIEKSNVLDHHNKQFSVNYRFNDKNILTEPTLLFGFFIVVFFIVILIGRIDFSFKGSKAKSD